MNPNTERITEHGCSPAVGYPAKTIPRPLRSSWEGNTEGFNSEAIGGLPPQEVGFNVVIGWHSGRTLTTGSNNILVGRELETSSPDASNEIAVRFSDGTEWRTTIPVPKGEHVDVGNLFQPIPGPATPRLIFPEDSLPNTELLEARAEAKKWRIRAIRGEVSSLGLYLIIILLALALFLR